MPGRRPLEIGTAGTFRSYARIDGTWTRKEDLPKGTRAERWRVTALFRDTDGKTRQIERSGSSETKATRALRQHIRDRGGTVAIGTITSGTRFADAAELWLVHKRHTTQITDGSLAGYESKLRKHALPELGSLLIRECDVPRLEQFAVTLKHNGLAASSRRSIVNVVSGVLALAVKHRAVTANPCRELDPIVGEPVRKATAMTAAELSDFLTKMDEDTRRSGADLSDLIRFLFGTGARFSEALAVRWCDLNLSDEPIMVGRTTLPPHSVWINAHVTEVRGYKVQRTDGETNRTKKSYRVVGLPDFLHTLLLVRKHMDATDDEPVFPSAKLTWRRPTDVQESIRRMRRRIGYPHFKTHVGRKTVATLLDDAGQTARQIADQLGHSSPSMTLDVYMGRGQFNADAAATLDSVHGPTTHQDSVT